MNVCLCRLVQASTGGRYYREALPILGFSCDAPNRPSREPGSPRILGNTFSVGDKVKVMVDAERLREMQEGHGGWNPRMADVWSYLFILLKDKNNRKMLEILNCVFPLCSVLTRLAACTV